MEVSNYIKMRDQMKESMALRLMTIISMCRIFLKNGE